MVACGQSGVWVVCVVVRLRSELGLPEGCVCSPGYVWLWRDIVSVRGRAEHDAQV